MVKDIRFYKANSLPTRPIKDAVIAVLNNTQGNFSLYITDINGVPVPLYSVSGGGGTIQTITNNDGSITITGTDEDKVITISSAMQSLINGALQNGDNITSLVNNAGYITLSDIPSFDPSNYDLTDFTNSDSDPFIRSSDLSVLGTNLGYTPSSNQGTVTSDTGSDAVIPLASVSNAGLMSPSEKGLISSALQSANNLSELHDPEEARNNLGLEIGVDVLSPTGSAANLHSFPTLNQNTTGSAASLTTARNINGTPFDGSQNITTSYWGTSRNLSIGGTSKAVDGSSNVTWSISEIGITKSNIDSLGINATTLNGTANYQLTSQKGQANGYAPLDSGGKVPMTHLPDAVFGTVIFGGTYDGNTIVSASSSFPELQGEALPDADDYPGVYFISVASYTIGTDDYEIGDWIISTGIEWVKVDNVDAVISFNGRIGDIIPIEEDYEDFYEPIIATKNTAFNKNFGTTSGTVAEGNHTHTFSSLTSKPTTLSGYGITDGLSTSRTITINGTTQDLSANRTWTVGDVLSSGSYSNPTWITSLAWSKISGKPTTIAGYGITDFNSLGDARWLKSSDYTASDVLTKIKTVDGTGSGLDADLLDGVEGDSYLRSDVSDNYTSGNLTFNNNTQIRIGNTSPAGSVGHLKLQATGTETLFDMGASIVMRDAGDSFNSRFTFSRNTGNFTAIGSITANSFIKSGGTSSQFLKADGSVDTNSYALSSHTHTFASLTSKPTTIGGYGITDFNSLGDARWFSQGISYNGNINTISISSHYILLSGATNIPAGEVALGSSLIHYQWDANTAKQVFYAVNTNNSYWRRKTSGTWGAWQKYWTDANDGSGSGLDADLLRGVHWGNVNTNINTSGTVTATNFILSSDERLKSNIKPIGSVWREFTMKGQKRYGVIAQEVEKIHPEIVHTDDKGYKSVAYVDLLCLKQAENEKLLKEKDGKIKELEERLSKLEKMLL